jgi:hypothetical protein
MLLRRQKRLAKRLISEVHFEQNWMSSPCSAERNFGAERSG